MGSKIVNGKYVAITPYKNSWADCIKRLNNSSIQRKSSCKLLQDTSTYSLTLQTNTD